MATHVHENVLAMAARRRSPAEPPPAGRGVSSELVVLRGPAQPRAEELRALRTRILIDWANAGLRRRALVVASPGPGEGRSYVAANLAVAFAQLGERTLLIDADLRSPRQQRIFGVPDRPGLAEVLAGGAGRRAETALPEFGSLALLTAGAPPPNPQELLLGPALAGLLEELAAEFDVLIFDSPPAALYADAQSLAFRAGGALVLARKDRTRVSDASRTLRELSVTGARVVGTVFNAF
ncbi:MAG: polysaccharide biosynthesis tyrosine autokinase [Burkholderiales bacterium]